MDTMTLAVELPLPFRSKIPFDVPTYNPANQYGSIKAYLNVSTNERHAGIYRPSFTYYQNPPGTDKPRYVLYVKFSVPKLIYGNNFQEFDESRTQDVVAAIQAELRRIGLDLSEEQILNTEITKYDVSKNVLFYFISTSQIIKDIATSDISTVFDVARHDFRNGGKSFHIHTNTEELVVYDKLYDLKRSKTSEKRAIETDNYAQVNLLEKLLQCKGLSIIRFEVRLNGKRKIRNTLTKIGIEEPKIAFKNLLSVDLARKILLHEWNTILDRIPKTPLLEDTPDGLLLRILQESGITPQKALTKLGMLYLLEAGDTRYVRNIFDERFGKHVWGRLKGSRDPPSSNQLKNLLSISKAIEEMKPIDINVLSP